MIDSILYIYGKWKSFNLALCFILNFLIYVWFTVLLLIFRDLVDCMPESYLYLIVNYLKEWSYSFSPDVLAFKCFMMATFILISFILSHTGN